MSKHSEKTMRGMRFAIDREDVAPQRFAGAFAAEHSGVYVALRRIDGEPMVQKLKLSRLGHREPSGIRKIVSRADGPNPD